MYEIAAGWFCSSSWRNAYMIGWWALFDQNLALTRDCSSCLSGPTVSFRPRISRRRFTVKVELTIAISSFRFRLRRNSGRRIKQRTDSRLVVLIVTCAPLYGPSSPYYYVRLLSVQLVKTVTIITRNYTPPTISRIIDRTSVIYRRLCNLYYIML